MDCLSASQFPYGMCKQGACNFDAFILCSDHKIDLCPSCALMFHYRCKLKISNESNYIDNAIKIIKCLVNSMEIHEQKYKYSKLELGFKAEIKNISESFESLISQIKEASKYDLQNLIQNIHDIMGSLENEHFYGFCVNKEKIAASNLVADELSNSEEQHALYANKTCLYTDMKEKEK